MLPWSRSRAPAGPARRGWLSRLRSTSIGDWPNGVWFVPLAPVTRRGVPRADDRQRRRGVAASCARRSAPDACCSCSTTSSSCPPRRPILAELLAACPDVRVLATSRTRLNLSIEQEYPVSTLPPADAAELFVQRARLRKPRFEPDDSVLEIARRLDGLPLALELAAARIKVLTPAQILERLGRSLDVLGGGPADLPSASARCGPRSTGATRSSTTTSKRSSGGSASSPAASTSRPPRQSAAATWTLSSRSSTRASSVRPGEGRFAMLHVLREFARDRLEAAGESHSASLRARSFTTGAWSSGSSRSSERRDTWRRSIAWKPTTPISCGRSSGRVEQRA